jgi:hypothetical protein
MAKARMRSKQIVDGRHAKRTVDREKDGCKGMFDLLR